MLSISALWRTLTQRSGPATPKQRDDAPTTEQDHAATDPRALYVPAPHPLRPELVARWEVEGLFPDATGRLRPRLRARWQVQKPGTPTWDDAWAPRVVTQRLPGPQITEEKRAS
jgi:hypothetical protein